MIVATRGPAGISCFWEWNLVKEERLTTPQYAILDECTSAVTLEIEKVMYDHATGECYVSPYLIGQ